MTREELQRYVARIEKDNIKLRKAEAELSVFKKDYVRLEKEKAKIDSFGELAKAALSQMVSDLGKRRRRRRKEANQQRKDSVGRRPSAGA
ncbi:MAG: hypothetical protein ACOX4F_09745 [Atopobiaceae bacterium]|jgi:predicted  nucleic acid-binding Zn-ribbon protein